MNFKNLKELYTHLDKNGLNYYDTHQISSLFKGLRDKYKGKREKYICQTELDAFNLSIKGNKLNPLISFTKENGIINEYPSLKDFNDESLQYLIKRVKSCSAFNIKAHYAHLLWFSQQKHLDYAKIAIDSYLRTIDQQIKSIDSISTDIDLQIRESLENALKLALSIKSSLNPFFKILGDIVNTIDPTNNKHLFLLLATSRLIKTNFKPFKNLPLINDLKEKLEIARIERTESGSFEEAIDLINYLIFFNGQKSRELKNKYLKLIAELWEKLSAQRTDRSNMVVLEFLRNSLELYKKLKDKESIKRLESEINEARGKVNLQKFSQEIDLTKQINSIRNGVVKLIENDSDYILSVLMYDRSIIPSINSLEDQTNKQRKDNPLQYIVPTQIYDRRGNVVQFFVSEEELFFNGLLKTLGIINKLSIDFVLREIMYQGIKKEKLTANIFITFLKQKTWLGYNLKKISPGGDELIYNWIDQISPSIYYYFDQMDVHLADHKHYPNLIMPIDSLSLKFEGLFRDLCEVLGISTFFTETDIHNKVISKERDLNSLLRDQNLANLIDKDDLFFFKYIFVEKSAMNLRNDVAHSLMIAEEYTTNKFHLLLLCLLRLGKYQLPSN